MHVLIGTELSRLRVSELAERAAGARRVRRRRLRTTRNPVPRSPAG